MKVTDLTFNTSYVSLEIGATFQIVATVSPGNATNKTLLWSTENSSVATVDDNGLVIANGPGSTTIQAKTDDGGITKTCSVKVAEMTNQDYWLYLLRNSGEFGCRWEELEAF